MFTLISENLSLLNPEIFQWTSVDVHLSNAVVIIATFSNLSEHATIFWHQSF